MKAVRRKHQSIHDDPGKRRNQINLPEFFNCGIMLNFHLKLYGDTVNMGGIRNSADGHGIAIQASAKPEGGIPSKLFISKNLIKMLVFLVN